MVVVLWTCLFRDRPTHWSTGTIASAAGSHALFESRNSPVNYGRVQIGIMASLSPGETRRRWSMCVLSIYRGIFSRRTRRDYGYGWDPYVDDFCIFIVRAWGFIFFSSKRYLFVTKNSEPSIIIRWCFGDRQRSVFFIFFFCQLYKFFKNIISALLRHGFKWQIKRLRVIRNSAFGGPNMIGASKDYKTELVFFTIFKSFKSVLTFLTY